jgi:hypothetical protein
MNILENCVKTCYYDCNWNEKRLKLIICDKKSYFKINVDKLTDQEILDGRIQGVCVLFSPRTDYDARHEDWGHVDVHISTLPDVIYNKLKICCKTLTSATDIYINHIESLYCRIKEYVHKLRHRIIQISNIDKHTYNSKSIHITIDDIVNKQYTPFYKYKDNGETTICINNESYIVFKCVFSGLSVGLDVLLNSDQYNDSNKRSIDMNDIEYAIFNHFYKLITTGTIKLSIDDLYALSEFTNKWLILDIKKTLDEYILSHTKFIDKYILLDNKILDKSDKITVDNFQSTIHDIYNYGCDIIRTLCKYDVNDMCIDDLAGSVNNLFITSARDMCKVYKNKCDSVHSIICTYAKTKLESFPLSFKKTDVDDDLKCFYNNREMGNNIIKTNQGDYKVFDFILKTVCEELDDTHNLPNEELVDKLYKYNTLGNITIDISELNELYELSEKYGIIDLNTQLSIYYKLNNINKLTDKLKSNIKNVTSFKLSGVDDINNYIKIINDSLQHAHELLSTYV